MADGDITKVRLIENMKMINVLVWLSLKKEKTIYEPE
jgi:hypothetical protein